MEREDAMDVRLSRALAGGWAALGRANTPELVIAGAAGLDVCESPLTAALVLAAAVGEPAAGAQEVGQGQLRFLLASRQPPGHWGISPAFQRLLPPHTDATVCALAALAQWGCPEVDCGAALGSVLAFARPEGACPAWLVEGNELRPERQRDADPVVNANVLFLGALLDRSLPAVAEAVGRFVARHGLNCRFASPSYTSPFVFAYFLARWLRRDAAGALAGLHERVVWDCVWRSREALDNALDCALALSCRLDLGPCSGEPGWDQGLETLAEQVLRAQSQAGLWPALPLFTDGVGNVYGSVQATTALCLEALRKLRRAREGGLLPALDRDAPWAEGSLRQGDLFGRGCEPGALPRPGTMEDTLRALAGCIPAPLVSATAYGHLLEVGRWLPGALTSGFGLECRLGEADPRADLLLCVTAQEDGREILAGLSAHAGLPEELQAVAEWRRIRDFCRQWSAPGSLLQDFVSDFWFEFDVAGALPASPLPSIFFCFGERAVPAEAAAAAELAGQSGRAIASGLELLWGRPLDPDLRRNLERCLRAIPAGAQVFALGAMLARRVDAVRFCVKNLPPERILDYLGEIGWAGAGGELRALIASLSGLVDRMHLDVDLASRVLPAVGLECSFSGRRQPAQEPRWRAFLDHLVSAGLCRPEKRDALLGWPGRHHCFEDLAGEFVVESYFNKLLGHVKIGLDAGGAAQAKGYLGAWRILGRRGWRPASAGSPREELEAGLRER
jgi:hypothetical protein